MTWIQWMLGGDPPAWLTRRPLWQVMILIAITLAVLFTLLAVIITGG